MATPRYVDCPNCGEKRDTSGNYTSPANQERDQRRWAEEHESGKCAANGPRAFSRDQISGALNRAADAVTDLAAQDDRVGDAINLVVNATLTFLESPDADLEAAVAANYSDSVDDVLGWVRAGN
ncbi:hypothetical protein C8K30_1011021 [Promicromonospora sp. AC04]|uniref:hypothetical protein n=1 Tax=Promicromonospora sp. AC04 TaxID=2135723 RepID=UPI000D3DAAFD|nr:hypothetical protein [Promicromonospora sp. AC04]PUB32495.1 hypothetical protein C8K30_1011021 [Promicromonospora sp. AC04]